MVKVHWLSYALIFHGVAIHLYMVILCYFFLILLFLTLLVFLPYDAEITFIGSTMIYLHTSSQTLFQAYAHCR